MRLKRYWMRNDFKPIHLRKANKILAKELSTVETDTRINQVYKKEIFDKRPLWKRILALFK